MSVQIPLFPLNTVLFPHMPAALHIFEDRYREMIRDCREQGTSFGVVGIREGLEVKARALPFSVGTLAQIRDLEALDDGRYNIVVTGASRFRVESLSLGRSYLMASVRYLQDSRGDEVAITQLAVRVAAAGRAYDAGLRRLSGDGEAEGRTEFPDDPERLSYVVAASLNVETQTRQELLEEDSVEGRLRACLRVLRRELAFLEQMLGRRPPLIVPVSLN